MVKKKKDEVYMTCYTSAVKAEVNVMFEASPNMDGSKTAYQEGRLVLWHIHVAHTSPELFGEDMTHCALRMVTAWVCQIHSTTPPSDGHNHELLICL